MMQSIPQFLNTYPALFPLAVFLIIFICGDLFGPWGQLIKSYQYKSSFVGQAWQWETVVLGKNSRGQFMTVGLNASGLYLKPTFSVRLHKSILIPWAELQVEKDQRWVGTYHHFRSASRPQITITIGDTLFQKMSAAAGGKLPLVQSSENAPDLDPSELEQSSLTPAKLKIQRKLVAKIFAVTFAIGLSVGLINHGIARCQVFQQPDRYQIYTPGHYQSIEYGKVWPDSFMEFLGLSQPVYVKVERNQGEVISETYYSFFGSTTTAKYFAGKWRGTGGSILSAPLYMINCVLPLALGWIAMMISLPLFGSLKLTNGNSQLVQRVNQIFTIIAHTIVMGIVNFLGGYWLPGTISMVIRIVSRGSLSNS